MRVPLAEVGVDGRGALAYLRRIPEATVRDLHANVQRARARVQYGTSGGTPGGDAVDALLEVRAVSLELSTPQPPPSAPLLGSQRRHLPQGLLRHFRDYEHARAALNASAVSGQIPRVPVGKALVRLVCGPPGPPPLGTGASVVNASRSAG